MSTNAPFIKRITKSPSIGWRKFAGNPHLWIIIAITVAVTVMYYGWQEWFPWFWHWFIYEFVNTAIGSLYFIPFLYASIVFWWRGSLTVWTLSEAAMIPCLLYYRSNLSAVLYNIGISIVPLAIVMLIVSQVEWRRRQRQLLLQREKERQTYLSEILKAQETERQHLAQDLHDGSIQELLVIANRAEALHAGEDDKLGNNQQVEQIRDGILAVVADLRKMSLELRPSIIDNIGLIPAIRWLVERLEHDGVITSTVAIEGTPRRLSADVEASMFRIVQEALNNVRRHSKANQTLVTLRFTPELLHIIVEDNGVGFSPPRRIADFAALGKLGIAGIDQRARLLGGSCHIQSQLGQGTSISVKLRC